MDALLAELDHVAEELLLEEGLPAGKVDLVHALLAQHAEAQPRLILCQAVRGLGGVEAGAQFKKKIWLDFRLVKLIVIPFLF